MPTAGVIAAIRNKVDLKQGETLSLTFQNVDENNDIASFTTYSAIDFEVVDDADALFLSVSLTSGAAQSPDLGLISIEATSTEIAAIPIARYKCDLRLETALGDVLYTEDIVFEISRRRTRV